MAQNNQKNEECTASVEMSENQDNSSEFDENATSTDTSQEVEQSKVADDPQKEIADLKNRYFRALADYQNLQRRSAKEVLEARSRGVEDFVKKLLPILDTLDKAMEQLSKTEIDKKLMDGLEMFYIQLTDVLEKEGLKPVSAKGKKFNTDFHEAMCTKSLDEFDDEIVLAEYEKGYTFNGRVLRTAKVEINQK